MRCARALEISFWVSGRPAAVLWRVRFGVAELESLRRDSFVRIGANFSLGELLVFVFVDGIDAVSDVPADSAGEGDGGDGCWPELELLKFLNVSR